MLAVRIIRLLFKVLIRYLQTVCILCNKPGRSEDSGADLFVFEVLVKDWQLDCDESIELVEE